MLLLPHASSLGPAACSLLALRFFKQTAPPSAFSKQLPLFNASGSCGCSTHHAGVQSGCAKHQAGRGYLSTHRQAIVVVQHIESAAVSCARHNSRHSGSCGCRTHHTAVGGAQRTGRTSAMMLRPELCHTTQHVAATLCRRRLQRRASVQDVHRAHGVPQRLPRRALLPTKK
jgi:hypothetical protein